MTRLLSAILQSSAFVALAAAVPTGAALAQGLEPIVFPLSETVKLTFYGQINQGALVYDDGLDTETYAPVDNSNSSTRAGIRIDGKFDGGLSYRGVLEVEYAPRPSKSVNIEDDVTNWNFDENNVRKAEFYLKGDRFGTLWLGQGSMATDGIAEIDLSGTEVAAYSAVSDIAGGNFYRFSDIANDPATEADESLSSVTVGSTFSNFDGSRRLRIRYDSPSLAGFVASVAYGEEVIKENDDNQYIDAAIVYTGEFSGVKAKAGIGYSDLDNDSSIVSGSASFLHEASGINLTLALGEQDKAGVTSNSGYVKIGMIRDFFEQGSTAFALDYQSSQEVKAQGGSAESIGFSVVQRFDRQNLETYGAIRSYSYSDTTSTYDDGLAVFAGVRFKF